jgi:hypothetical protein
MAYDIGGMLARSGATTGQLMGGGIANVGAGIGGLLTRRREKQSEQNAQQQFQQILGATSNRPSEMLREAQLMMASGDPNLQRVGKMLMDEATRLAGVQTAKTEKGTAQGIQGGLSAITQAAARSIPLADLQEGVRSVINLGGTQAQIMSAYQAGVDMAEEKQTETVSVSPGGALVDKRTGEVIYERGFKPTDTGAPKVSFVKTKDDKQVLVFEGSDLVNTIEVEGDSNEEIAARETVISSTSNTLQTVKEAKDTLRQSYLGMDPGGISGALTGLIPGSPSHELMTSTYVTIAGKEALDEINRMKAEAAKFGSRGTGLGQVTQIEFAALQGNLAKLNTGLTVDRQLDLLNKIEQKLESTRRIASGENPIDVIDFNEPVYIEAGYVKEGGEVYYFAPGGKEFIYNRNKEAFVPVGG